jgi:hypothetical protein
MSDLQILRALAVNESILHLFEPREECGGTIGAFEVRRIAAPKVLKRATRSGYWSLRLHGLEMGCNRWDDVGYLLGDEGG